MSSSLIPSVGERGSLPSPLSFSALFCAYPGNGRSRAVDFSYALDHQTAQPGRRSHLFSLGSFETRSNGVAYFSGGPLRSAVTASPRAYALTNPIAILHHMSLLLATSFGLAL